MDGIGWFLAAQAVLLAAMAAASDRVLPRQSVVVQLVVLSAVGVITLDGLGLVAGFEPAARRLELLLLLLNAAWSSRLAVTGWMQDSSSENRGWWMLGSAIAASGVVLALRYGSNWAAILTALAGLAVMQVIQAVWWNKRRPGSRAAGWWWVWWGGALVLGGAGGGWAGE